MFRVILTVLKTAMRWIAPGLIGYVAGDIISNHEQSGTEDTIKEVARSAAGTASTNWIKWLAFMVIGTAIAVVTIFVFKIKVKK